MDTLIYWVGAIALLTLAVLVFLGALSYSVEFCSRLRFQWDVLLEAKQRVGWSRRRLRRMEQMPAEALLTYISDVVESKRSDSCKVERVQDVLANRDVV